MPDILRHRVTVLDSAGNVVTRFGTRGNQDSADSRIGLSDPMWVAAASDRVYIGDGQAWRIIRVRLEPTTEAACEAEIR